MMSQPPRYALFTAFDEDYSLPAAVALRSLSMHWTAPAALDVYVIDSGIAPRSRSRMEESIVEDRMRLHWCRIDVEPFLDLPRFPWMKSQIYHRLALGEVVPGGVDRVVWLDMDVLALRCIAALWEIDLQGQPLGAVQDLAIPWVSSPLGLGEFEGLGLDRKTPYFNSGVMVIDMPSWRENGMAARLTGYLREHAEHVVFCDQHALNALYAGRWFALDPRWNVNASLAGRRYLGTTCLPEEISRGASSPWIVHFAGTFKPWRFPLADAVFHRYQTVLREISSEVPPAGWVEQIFCVYFRYFRRILYPLERLCWILRHRWPRRRS